MMFATSQSIRRVKAGDPITAYLLNSIADRLWAFANIKATGPYLVSSSAPWTGTCLHLAVPRKTAARLTSNSSPYSWEEVDEGPNGTWVTRAVGDGGTNNAYETNNVAGLSGNVYWLTWTGAGDYRFQAIRLGPPPPCDTDICVIISGGCNGMPIPAAITVTKDDEIVGTCIASGEIGSLSLVNGGSGYTNGTGYSLGISGGGGTGATGTFNVVGGKITNPVITNRGTGYTGIPTISFPGAGAGTGATVAVVMQSRCCITVDVGGSYSVEAESEGFVPGTSNVTVTCGTTSTATIALVKISGYSCCNGCPAPPTSETFTVTDSNSSCTLKWYSNSGDPGWYGGYTFTSGSVLRTNVDAGPCECNCCGNYYYSGSVGVLYKLACISGVWTLLQQWLDCNCQPFCPEEPSWEGFQSSECAPGNASFPPYLQPLSDASCGILPNSISATTATIACDPFEIEFSFPGSTPSEHPTAAPGTAVVTRP